MLALGKSYNTFSPSNCMRLFMLQVSRNLLEDMEEKCVC